MSIQDAIDLRSAAGGGVVQVPAQGANHTISATVTVPAGVILDILPGAVLENTADVDAVQVKNGGGVRGGGKIYCSHATFSKACLLYHANVTHGSFTRQKLNYSDNLLLEGPDFGSPATPRGYGLHLLATSDDPTTIYRVEWARFSGFTCNYLKQGVRCETNRTSGDQVAYVNSNIFTGFRFDYVEDCYYYDDTGSGTGDLDSNFMIDTFLQARDVTKGVAYSSGEADRCFINGLVVWDKGNATSPRALWIDTSTSGDAGWGYNGIVGLNEDEINLNGWGATLSHQANSLPQATSAQLASSAATINTSRYKRAGWMVWDTTNGQPVWALGSAATDDWVDGTGSVVHNP